MKRSVAAMLLFLGLSRALSAQDADSTSLTRTGQVPPDFTVRTLAGESFTLSAMKGRVVLLSFFATWCPSCREELPALQKGLWEPFREAGLTVLALGREHSAAELDTFRTRNGFTFDFAPDADRSVFRQYATKYIPRTVLVGKDGRILRQTLGYKPGDADSLVLAVARALKR
jgi:peroxiredoxin